MDHFAGWSAHDTTYVINERCQQMISGEVSRKLTIPAPLQRLHVSGLVPGGTPVPPKINHRKT